MKVLYLDCTMGAAGDMLTAALLSLLPDPDTFLAELNGLGFPHVCFLSTALPEGLCVTVRTDCERHGETTLSEIEATVRRLPVSERVICDVLSIYALIGESESRAHSCPIEQVHFHEVGAIDSIADITAVCLLMERLSPDRVLASPVHVGCGTVRCAHGVLPVPTPATAYILRDVPTFGGTVQGELCTPTGAALLKRYASAFGPAPRMRVLRTGSGVGNGRFATVNRLTATLGEI